MEKTKAKGVLVDDAFRVQIPPLAKAEKEILEASIIQEGCREPLTVWRHKGKLILLDGHNRLEICQRLGIPFKTVAVSEKIKTRKDAEDWIDTNQLGQRNLTPDAFRLLLGRRYNRQKKRHGQRGESKKIPHFEVSFSGSTDIKLAKEHGISPVTVQRAAKFAKEVESTPEFLEAIQNRQPIHKVRKKLREQQEQKHEQKIKNMSVRKLNSLPPQRGIAQAERAIMQLELIAPNDSEKQTAFQMVRRYLDDNE